jgi:hypothetical protein
MVLSDITGILVQGGGIVIFGLSAKSQVRRGAPDFLFTELCAAQLGFSERYFAAFCRSRLLRLQRWQ